jgi:hypothetical protein
MGNTEYLQKIQQNNPCIELDVELLEIANVGEARKHCV